MELSIDKTKTYLLGCSYGPDSMALLDMLLKEGVDLVVCHVNYHKRGEVSNYEEKTLREYCGARKIKFECLDTNKIDLQEKKINFQAYARDIRYSFFKDVYKKYNAAGLFIAHQLDDLLETYLLQKERKAFVSYYGLSKESYRYEMKIIRPLLNYTKAELEKYDLDNNIPYSIDSSNLTDAYKRNKIRHTIIEKMSKKDKETLLEEISNENKKIKIERKEAQKILSRNSALLVSDVNKLTLSQFIMVLFFLLNPYGVYSISNKKAQALKELTKSNKPNIKVKLENNIFYCQEYGEILIYETKSPYSYKIEKPGIYSFVEFDIDFSDAKDRNINIIDYPLTIRNASKNDEYIIKDYSKKLSRLFLDWKMPWHLREQWPVIVNKNGSIIYIPRYRKIYADNHKSKFLIKLH